ncbi:MAG: type II toxin-antitoxin system VapC family toxin [Thermomicrobiales bacterium]
MSVRSLPSDIYLDTSVVVAGMYPGTPDAAACRTLCQQLAAARSHVYFSQALRLDLARAMRRLATKANKLAEDDQVRYRLDQWATNPLVRQRWLANGVRRFHAFLDQFEEAVEIPLTTAQWRQSLELMATETLDATDAMHLAVARWYDIPDFATTDRDFRRVTLPMIHLIRDADPT